MLEINKYSAKGKEVGKIELPASLFAAEAKNPRALLYEVIKMYRANQRQGTASVKNRAAITGSTRKLFKQKGTGNARPGDIKSPLRVGGGMAFGPQPHDWYKKIPKKKKRLALKLALTAKAAAGEVIVVESFDLEEPNTKFARELIEGLITEKKRALVLVDSSSPAIVRSFSNLPYVKMNRADSTFAYEVLNAGTLIITEDALQKMVEVFAK
ncbi:MAG: 50S ribosomal protein L4 [Candidatus Cloacimonadales bacterium]